MIQRWGGENGRGMDKLRYQWYKSTDNHLKKTNSNADEFRGNGASEYQVFR